MDLDDGDLSLVWSPSLECIAYVLEKLSTHIGHAINSETFSLLEILTITSISFGIKTFNAVGGSVYNRSMRLAVMQRCKPHLIKLERYDFIKDEPLLSVSNSILNDCMLPLGNKMLIP